LNPISEPDVEAVWSAEIERRLVEIDAGTVELIPWDDVRLELFRESKQRIMAMKSETVETLEAAALQLTPADRARQPLMLIPKSKKPAQRKSNADKPKSKMELLLSCAARKASPN
jgi:hypothetical protein